MSTTSASTPSGTARRRPTFSGFAVRLFFNLFGLSLCFSLGSLQTYLGPVQRLMAQGVVVAARGLGAEATVQGAVIQVPEKALEINHECTGIFVLLVYIAFVLAYPAPWTQRASGVAIGCIVLNAVNFARLVVLTLIAGWWPDWFDYSHEYFFQGVFIALLAFLGSVWTEQVRRAVLRRVPG